MTRSLRLVVLGLSLSSSWGNGHAATYRALLAALAARGHRILFLERDMPWYAAHRDMPDPAFCELRLYRDLEDLAAWRASIGHADLVIVGSYVPDGGMVARFVQRHAGGVTAFYDIDTPVTLAKLAAGDHEYISPELIPGFDLYLSFTGGPTLQRLESEYGARMARALYCSVDPEIYQRTDVPRAWDLGYLGTYSADRQERLERLLLTPARRDPALRCVVAGAQYPDDIDWPGNVTRIEHLPPSAHPDFYSSLGWTLNITRTEMVAAGWSPSVRLFEAASCASPILTDNWPGLDSFLRIGSEVRLAEDTEDVLAALALPEPVQRRIGERARRRIVIEHSAAQRAELLESYLTEAAAHRPGDGLAAIA